MKKRKDIASEYKWDLSSYFKNEEEWQKAFDDLSGKFLKLKDFEGRLDNKTNILDCLNLMSQIDEQIEALYIFAHCSKDVDVTNARSQERSNKMEAKLTEYYVLISFFTPQMSKLPQEFLEELSKDNDFSAFSKVLKDIIREKPHTLSEENEKLLSHVSSFSKDFSSNFSNFENGDLKFKKVLNKKSKPLPMNQSLASTYLRQEDAVLRENAFKELNGAFGRYNNFLTSNYLASVKKDIFYAKAKKFNTALESALFYEEVSAEVYKKLLESVSKNIFIEFEYFELKRKLLKLKQIKISDVYYNPLKLSKKYSYEEAFDVVCKSLEILGEDYISNLKKLKEQRKIDVFPNENKSSGAYQTAAYKKSPLVLLNFNGNIDAVSTIAHELGHAMHSFYSDANQSIFNAQYPIFLAEIASIVNEILLSDYLCENAKNKDEKLFYVNEFLSRFHATVFRQTMFADFEHKVHEMVENNMPVSSQILNETYLKFVKSYFGKKVKVFDCVKYEWSRIPHFFTAFYVYKYATGLICALNIVHNLKAGKITVEDYKKFLSSGCSSDPITLLKIVKINIEEEEPFEVAFDKAKEYIAELKRCVKQK